MHFQVNHPQAKLVQAITEPVKLDSGDVFLEGTSILAWDVRTRRDAGIGHIPEDRQRYGLLLPFTLADNLTLGQHHRPPFIRGFQWVDTAKIREYARKTIEAFDIRCRGPAEPVRRLSGGNQQKVCLARAYTLEPELLFVSEPTRGVDVGAKERVLDVLVKMNRDYGATIVLTSSELAELRRIADRIAVIDGGEVKGIVPPEP